VTVFLMFLKLRMFQYISSSLSSRAASENTKEARFRTVWQCSL